MEENEAEKVPEKRRAVMEEGMDVGGREGG